MFFSFSASFRKKSSIQVLIFFIPEEGEIGEIWSAPQLMSFAHILLQQEELKPGTTRKLTADS